MDSAAYSISHSGRNAITSVTPANVFALIFEILVFILIVLSIVTLVRRYSSRRAQTQTPAQTTFGVDLEVQAGRSVKHASPSSRISMLFGRLRSRSRDECLGDTAALLEKDGSETLPTPVSSSPRSSLPNGTSFLHKLSGHFGGITAADVKSVVQPKPSHLIVRSCHSRVGGSGVHPHIRTLQHGIRELPVEIPQIVITPPEETVVLESSETEMFSPASTYSEPDSPTIATPPLESSTDAYVRIADGEESHFSVPFPSWETAAEAENVVASGNALQLGEPLVKSIVTSESDDAAAQPTLPLSSSTDILSHVLFSIDDEEDTDEGQEARSTASLQVDATTTAVLPDGSTQAIDDEKPEAPRIINACAQLDPAPIREFLLTGPALVTPINNSAVYGASSDAEEEEDWEKAFRVGGRLLGAFSSPPSCDSFDEDDDYGCDLDDQPGEEYLVLQKTKAAHQVQVHSPHADIPCFSATVEWYESASSVPSDSEGIDSHSDHDNTGSDLENDSSFYSCSGSSYTEDVSEADDSFFKVGPSIDFEPATALSALERFCVERCATN